MTQRETSKIQFHRTRIFIRISRVGRYFSNWKIIIIDRCIFLLAHANKRGDRRKRRILVQPKSVEVMISSLLGFCASGGRKNASTLTQKDAQKKQYRTKKTERKLQHTSSLSKCAPNTQCLKITQNVAFEFWHFPPIFVLLKLTCLVTLYDRKLQVFKNSPKWIIFGIFN